VSSHPAPNRPVAPVPPFPATPPQRPAGIQNKEKENHESVAYGNYPGMTRAQYWMGTLGIGILILLIGALLTTVMKNKSEAGFLILVFTSIFGFVQLGMAWSRMKNIGMEPAWSLLMLIPVVGLLPHVRCLIFQKGYEETKKLDRTGKTLCWIVVGLFVAPLLLGVVFATFSHFNR